MSMHWFRNATVVLLVGMVTFSLLTSRLEPYEIGLERNWVSGETVVISSPGIRFVMPWVFVTAIDTRPMRVCMTSTAHAVLACKLARFDPAHVDKFLEVEGWRLYWWSNRLSYNVGHEETYRGFRDVMRGYAFSVQQYAFVDIVEEY